jgi:dUTPase
MPQIFDIFLVLITFGLLGVSIVPPLLAFIAERRKRKRLGFHRCLSHARAPKRANAHDAGYDLFLPCPQQDLLSKPWDDEAERLFKMRYHYLSSELDAAFELFRGKIVKSFTEQAPSTDRFNIRDVALDAPYLVISSDKKNFYLGIKRGTRCMLPTGLNLHIPAGMVGQIKMRSSLAALHGIIVGGGEIDAPYRGHVYVCLINTDQKVDAFIPVDSAIAQIEFVRVYGTADPPGSVLVGDMHEYSDDEWNALLRDEKGANTRSAGGFGSSDKR